MSGHRSRADMVSVPHTITSTVEAELLETRDVWGIHYILDRRGQGSNATRKIPPPAHPGQRLEFSQLTTGGTEVTDVSVHGGDDIGLAGDTIVRFTGDAAAILESFEGVTGPYWNATYLNGAALV